MKSVLLAMAVLASPAIAQTPNWATAQTVNVTMTDHGFVPRTIAVRRGAPYVLHISNRSDKGHNLTQKAFFAAARVLPRDRGWTRDGQIVLPAGGRATVRFLAPLSRPGGTYEFSSTTLGDADNDYKGTFLIH